MSTALVSDIFEGTPKKTIATWGVWLKGTKRIIVGEQDNGRLIRTSEITAINDNGTLARTASGSLYALGERNDDMVLPTLRALGIMTISHYYRVKVDTIVPWPCPPEPNRTLQLFTSDVLTRSENGTYMCHTGLGKFGIVIHPDLLEGPIEDPVCLQLM